MATTAPASDAATTEIAAAEAAEREYIVFGLDSNGEHTPESWTEVGRCMWGNRDEARDKVIDALPVDEQAGPFVTIAARYWQPETFVVETTTVRKARR